MVCRTELLKLLEESEIRDKENIVTIALESDSISNKELISCRIYLFDSSYRFQRKVQADVREYQPKTADSWGVVIRSLL